MDRFGSPSELVDALQRRDPAARRELREGLREPVARLLDGLIVRHGLEQDRAVLLSHALHSAETVLRTLPHETIAGLSWPALRSSLLLHVAKFAHQPFGRPLGRPAPLAPTKAYHTELLFHPYERLGDHRFGGDWFVGQESPDGAYWVALADVTGHGYHAYLLAAGLPEVWRQCWASVGAGANELQPADLLGALHDRVADCLPEGIFLECTVARLGPEGAVTVGPAGATRLVLHRAGRDAPDEHRLRGAWLGLRAPSRSDQHHWELLPGDELLLATDGLFDQIDGGPGLLGPGGRLRDRVGRVLDEALASGPQKDDITVVVLRRKAGSPPAPAGGPVDVPV